MTRCGAVPAAVVILLLTVFGGCSSSAGGDYVPVSVDRLTVDRPAGWDLDVVVESPWQKGFRDAPDVPDQLRISGDFGSYATAQQGMGTLIGKAQVGLPGFTVVETREVTVKGATTAQLTRYTIDGDAGELHGVWIVAAHWPYPQSVAVSVLSTRRDPSLESRLIDSMELAATR